MLRPNFNQQIMLAADRQDAEIKRKKENQLPRRRREERSDTN